MNTNMQNNLIRWKIEVKSDASFQKGDGEVRALL